jgi:hypothetical protein
MLTGTSPDSGRANRPLDAPGRPVILHEICTSTASKPAQLIV